MRREDVGRKSAERTGEIEVAPEIIPAGMEELRSHRPAEDSVEEAEECVRSVYLAMVLRAHAAAETDDSFIRSRKRFATTSNSLSVRLWAKGQFTTEGPRVSGARSVGALRRCSARSANSE